MLYVGSATGKDGIHGATFASVELGPDSESKRPNVQMGDPFAEKLLIEATLEALATGYVVGIQDMGAAGLTCSTCETAAKAGMGMTIDVRLVPQREAGMTAYEIMLSESQERMLAIIEKGHEDEVAAVFHKWGLNAVVIGEVTDTGTVVIKDGADGCRRSPGEVADGRLPDLFPGRVRAGVYPGSPVRRFVPSARTRRLQRGSAETAGLAVHRVQTLGV